MVPSYIRSECRALLTIHNYCYQFGPKHQRPFMKRLGVRDLLLWNVVEGEWWVGRRGSPLLHWQQFNNNNNADDDDDDDDTNNRKKTK